MVKRTPVTAPVAVEKIIPNTNVEMSYFPAGVGPFIPDLDPYYFFREPLVEELAYAVKENQNCMLVGDAGAGKSSAVVQLAAQLNKPLRRLNMNGESDTTVLLGRDYPTVLDNGARALEYRWGPLALAVKNGWWVLIDEIDAAMQPVLFCLQQLIEQDGKLVLEDADATVVEKHSEFRFFATANTVGIAGRHRLFYTGTTQRLNEATLDRFGVVIDVGYMPEDQEVKVIGDKVPDLDVDYVQAIVQIANETRKDLQNDKLSCTFSTRRCLHWAQAMTKFHPLRAAQITILNKLDADDGKVVAGVIQRYFGSP